MVQKEIKFSDGTRIFYEVENGIPQRFIEYSYTQQEKEQMKKHPLIKKALEDKVRKHNAGKYYYLQILNSQVEQLGKDEKYQIYNDLKDVHDKVGTVYDKSLIEDFPQRFGKYWPDNAIQWGAFFVTIYLAMLDLEDSKWKYPNSIGKTMVLKSCEAVILGGKDPSDAAKMFERKKNSKSDDYFAYDDICTYDDADSRYEKYHGYNGYDDDTIDEAFDGIPEATWNVD